MGIFITPLWSEYIVSADQGGIFMDHFNVYSDIQARTGGENFSSFRGWKMSMPASAPGMNFPSLRRGKRS